MTIDQIKRKYAIQRVLKIIKPMAEKEGFIPVSRKALESYLFNEEKEKTRLEAFMDLHKKATYSAETYTLIKGETIKLFRGELVGSLRFLGNNWGWSTTKVDRFLSDLLREKLITKRTANGSSLTIITICELAKNNLNFETKGENKRQQSDSEKTVKRQQNDNIKEDNKVNNLIIQVITYETANKFFATTRNYRVLRELHKIPDSETLDNYFKEFFDTKVDLGEFKNKTNEDLVRHFGFWLPKYLKSKKDSVVTGGPESKLDKANNRHSRFMQQFS